VAFGHPLQERVDLHLRVARLVQIRQLDVFEKPAGGVDPHAGRGDAKLARDVALREKLTGHGYASPTAGETRQLALA
jgi:hypothetical protein